MSDEFTTQEQEIAREAALEIYNRFPTLKYSLEGFISSVSPSILTALRQARPTREQTSGIPENFDFAGISEVARRAPITQTKIYLQQALSVIESLRGQKSSTPLTSGIPEAWRRELPDESGLWWWWNEDEDSECIPVHIMLSGGDGNFFASIGQYGWTRAQPVGEMGGLWMRLHEPSVGRGNASLERTSVSSPSPCPVPTGEIELPAVGGRRLDCSNSTFERRALVALAHEQEKLNPDNALIALYCDAVRLTREYSDAMNLTQAVPTGEAEDCVQGCDKHQTCREAADTK